MRFRLHPQSLLVAASGPCYPGHMSKKVRITETEWPIMNFLWNRESATAAQIIEAVSPLRTGSIRTIKALIHRLLQKNLIAFTADERDSRVYHYRALVGREEGIDQKKQTMLNTVYAGKIGDLLMHFVDEAELEAGEIDDLMSRLAKKKASLRDKGD